MKELGLVDGEYPYQDAPLWIGKMSTVECHKLYQKKTFEGGIQLTIDSMRDAKLECASVRRKPLKVHQAKKLSGEPLHSSSGMIHHFMDEVRKE